MLLADIISKLQKINLLRIIIFYDKKKLNQKLKKSYTFWKKNSQAINCGMVHILLKYQLRKIRKTNKFFRYIFLKSTKKLNIYSVNIYLIKFLRNMFNGMSSFK